MYGAWQCSIVLDSCSQGILHPTMAENVPVKPYADHGSDLDMAWAQSISATLTCFGCFDKLGGFR